MPAHSAGFWADVGMAIEGAWSEATIWYGWNDFTKLDWEQEIRNGTLELPFVVVRPQPMGRPPGVPMTSVWYGGNVRFAYVLMDDSTDVEQVLDDRMDVMEAWLIANFRAQFTAIQPTGMFERDIGLNSEGAEALRQQKLPESAAEFTFGCKWPGTNF